MSDYKAFCSDLNDLMLEMDLIPKEDISELMDIYDIEIDQYDDETLDDINDEY